VILIALWIWSYASRLSCRGAVGDKVLNVQSLRSEVGIALYDWRGKPFPFYVLSEPDNMESTLWPPVNKEGPLSMLGFRWLGIGTDKTFVVMPTWFLVTSFATFAAAPWIPWRFDLHALVIGTSLLR
jgi:hypothetical protein